MDNSCLKVDFEAAIFKVNKLLLLKCLKMGLIVIIVFVDIDIQGLDPPKCKLDEQYRTKYS